MIDMMAITTSSSISVKPARRRGASVCSHEAVLLRDESFPCAYYGTIGRKFAGAAGKAAGAREQSSMGAAVSPERLADAEALLARGVAEGLYTHAVYALARGGQVLGRRAFGAATPDTLFDLASLTKPMATATLCLQLAEQGRLHLRQSVSRFFEADYGPLPHLEDVQVRHLLTHTSGLPPDPPLAHRDADARPDGAHPVHAGDPPAAPAGRRLHLFRHRLHSAWETSWRQKSGKTLAAAFTAGVAGPIGP